MFPVGAGLSALAASALLPQLELSWPDEAKLKCKGSREHEQEKETKEQKTVVS